MSATTELAPLAVVTGAGSGIGRAIALQLAALGYELALLDIDSEAVGATAALVADQEERTLVVVGDVTADATWESLVEQLADRPVSLLVNNAGTLLVGELTDCVPDALRRVVNVNLTSALLGCRSIVPRLSVDPYAPLPAGVLNVSSIFATLSPPGFAAYNASKAGLVALSETLHGELRPLGLRVAVVLPGVVPTGLFDHGQYSDDRLRTMVTTYLEKAELTPDRVASEALGALRRGRLVMPIGRRATWLWRAKRWLPTWLLDRVARRAVRLIQASTRSK